MLSISTFINTAGAVYLLMAVTTWNPLWFTVMTLPALQQIGLIWLIMLAFVGAINFIFERD